MRLNTDSVLLEQSTCGYKQLGTGWRCSCVHSWSVVGTFPDKMKQTLLYLVSGTQLHFHPALLNIINPISLDVPLLKSLPKM